MMNSIPDKINEYCKECESETTHFVSIEIVQESDNTPTEVYSREPYRISQCANCERTEQVRMNKIRADGETDEPSTPTLDELTAKEHETLRAIYANPGATQEEIGEILDVCQTTVSNRVNDIDGFEWDSRDVFVTQLFDGVLSPSVPGGTAETGGKHSEKL